MAFNKNKLREKIASFDKSKKGGAKLTLEQQEQQEKIKKYIWKPEPGEQIIRIVPLKDTPDFPFVELKWHYDFNGDKRNYLSPSSINKPDPIVELANKLEKNPEKNKATWLKGRKMQPKTRTYVPIIVRGREEEGVKFWGFGVQVYEKITNDMTEYDDITDFSNGNDIKIIFKTAEEVGKDYPETSVTIKPRSCPVIPADHPKFKEIIELITKKQPNIFDIYTPASYDDLAAALELKLESEKNGIESTSAPRGAERVAETNTNTDDDDTVVLPTEAEIEAAISKSKPTTVAEIAPAVSPSLQKSKTPNVSDFEAAFKNIFPEKK